MAIFNSKLLVYQRVIFTGFDPSKIQTIVPRAQWPSCTYDPVLQTPSPAMPAEKESDQRQVSGEISKQTSLSIRIMSFFWLENLLRFTPKADADPDKHFIPQKHCAIWTHPLSIKNVQMTICCCVY
jgi:hypothetical protein